MITIYLQIGLVVGLIFAIGVIVLGITSQKDLTKIVSKNNDSMASNATILVVAVVANVLVWPVIIGYLIKKFCGLRAS